MACHLVSKGCWRCSVCSLLSGRHMGLRWSILCGPPLTAYGKERQPEVEPERSDRTSGRRLRQAARPDAKSYGSGRQYTDWGEYTQTELWGQGYCVQPCAVKALYAANGRPQLFWIELRPGGGCSVLSSFYERVVARKVEGGVLRRVSPSSGYD
ncbi:hypothetical protein BDK51DRAFT_33282 [Blyttiomyces helicus]|uniref:Uncharacterized protein n=1 Tax=Blyttiomyces helicus TaxID=388810 RepID=A0A4P9WS88_9FUNG|nr:hypothetical protein BDK51DRAFT_33282 [Blyttiomyces helicus]|eukprot:RKO93856.1 hypothetical protein BDK51DRAFT_33282 [Blyttiomyces helicus]